MPRHGRVWPVPRTRYLKLVSCSAPTGPRACSLPVAMPISAPMPNSPPSANCVEALCSTMALIDLGRKRSAARVVLGDDRIGVLRAVASRYGAIAAVDAVDDAHRDDRVEIFGAPVLLGRRLDAARQCARSVASPRTSQPASLQALRRAAPGALAAQRLSTSSVSAAPQTPVRRILALRTMRRAIVEVGGRVDVDVADAFEVREDRHARLLLHARDQALAAARHDHVDSAVEAARASRRRRRGRSSARAGSRPPAGRLRAGPRRGRRGSRGRAQSVSEPPRRMAALPALRQSAPGVGGDVRPALEDHADHADRRAHALDVQAVRPRPTRR